VRRFEELDWQATPIGAVSLRRRHDPRFDTEVYEVKLDDDFLMSSLFTVAEVELARLGLAKVGPAASSGLDVVVGGLGLGYTALTVLEDARVRSLIVVEALGPVIDWHERGLVPAGPVLTADPRCRFVLGDFMALNQAGAGFDPRSPGRRFDAVLVDIDHSPSHLLHPSHAGFYRPSGLARLAAQLRPGGVFALWSNDPPDPAFVTALSGVFGDVDATVVRFDNPLQDREATNTVYLARA
jgi:spermidine synthase